MGAITGDCIGATIGIHSPHFPTRHQGGLRLRISGLGASENQSSLAWLQDNTEALSSFKSMQFRIFGAGGRLS